MSTSISFRYLWATTIKWSEVKWTWVYSTCSTSWQTIFFLLHYPQIIRCKHQFCKTFINHHLKTSKCMIRHSLSETFNYPYRLVGLFCYKLNNTNESNHTEVLLWNCETHCVQQAFNNKKGQCKMQTADWLRTIVFRVRKQWDYCCHILICTVKSIVCSLHLTLTDNKNEIFLVT